MECPKSCVWSLHLDNILSCFDGDSLMLRSLCLVVCLFCVCVVFLVCVCVCESEERKMCG